MFFDFADWALGKQGTHKSKGPLEALRPKLQPTPHQQSRSRRSAYAPAGEGEGEGTCAHHSSANFDRKLFLRPLLLSPPKFASKSNYSRWVSRLRIKVAY